MAFLAAKVLYAMPASSHRLSVCLIDVSIRPVALSLRQITKTCPTRDGPFVGILRWVEFVRSNM